MGLSPKPLFVSLDLVGKDPLDQGSSNSITGPLEAQAAQKRRKQRVLVFRRSNRPRPRRRILMKRRRRAYPYIEGSRSTTPAIKIQRKVRTLKRLVPNSTESMSLDGLFRETADYILDLQMRVKLMQIMVKALSVTSDDQ